ncbi:MAG: hypothetical protein M1529_00100 [Candidatus Thermoplasmatota archaeon]|nr:hypothetical protein [Candidatus Thermoplasmatota archaeon]
MKNEDKPKTVVLDTNSLIYMVKAHLDLREQIPYLLGKSEIIIPKCVVNELIGLSSGNVDARTALGMIDRFKIVESDGSGDECVLKTAVKVDGIVVTNDRDLSLKLQKKGIKCVMFTGKKRLAYWNIKES